MIEPRRASLATGLAASLIAGASTVFASASSLAAAALADTAAIDEDVAPSIHPGIARTVLGPTSMSAPWECGFLDAPTRAAAGS